MRWRQLELAPHGWKRRPSLFTLSQRGSAVLASAFKWDASRLAKRSWQLAEQNVHLTHDLEVVEFFVQLAAASQSSPDQGLYHWLGQDTLRRGYQEQGILNLAPDGFGRYLTENGEILFFLEWDRGSEPQRHLNAKARSYADYFSAHSSAPVLFVAPHPLREKNIRVAIAQISHFQWRSRFWTTNLELLQVLGVLGEIWLGGEKRDEHRQRITELPAARRSERVAEHSVGKPGWWNYRPGAGEGA